MCGIFDCSITGDIVTGTITYSYTAAEGSTPASAKLTVTNPVWNGGQTAVSSSVNVLIDYVLKIEEFSSST